MLFLRSNWLRAALCAMRIVQFCAGESAPLRAEVSLMELAAALQRVMRQRRLHRSTYASQVAKDPSVGGRPVAKRAGVAHMSLDQILQAALLECAPRNGRITFTELMRAVRNKRTLGLRAQRGDDLGGLQMSRIQATLTQLVVGIAKWSS